MSPTLSRGDLSLDIEVLPVCLDVCRDIDFRHKSPPGAPQVSVPTQGEMAKQLTYIYLCRSRLALYIKLLLSPASIDPEQSNLDPLPQFFPQS